MASTSNPAGGNPGGKRLFSPAKDNLGAPYAKAVKGVTLEDFKTLLDGFADNMKSEFCLVKDDLKQLNTKISSLENNVKVLGPELARVTSRVQNLQRQMDLQYRQKAAEYAWDHPSYIAQMCNLRAFGEAVNAIMTRNVGNVGNANQMCRHWHQQLEHEGASLWQPGVPHPQLLFGGVGPGGTGCWQ